MLIAYPQTANASTNPHAAAPVSDPVDDPRIPCPSPPDENPFPPDLDSQRVAAQMSAGKRIPYVYIRVVATERSVKSCDEVFDDGSEGTR
jgi:hypothetical protein